MSGYKCLLPQRRSHRERNLGPPTSNKVVHMRGTHHFEVPKRPPHRIYVNVKKRKLGALSCALEWILMCRNG
jgi:hypothetical protein